MTLRFSPARGAGALSMYAMTRGPAGPAATVAVGTVTELAPGATPTVANGGSSSAATLNFGLPGTPTIEVGNVTTLAAGQPATVTNSGTAEDIVLDFAIPQGVAGATGINGTPIAGRMTSWFNSTTVEDAGFTAASVYRSGGTDVAVADGGTGASTASAAATNLGLGTGDSPQFTAVNLGHATDTTLTRTGAGDFAVEGNAVYRAGGTDVPVTDGGTGASTAAGALTNLTAMGQGRHTIWIPASAMISRTTNGAAAGTAEMTTNKNMFKTLDFDASTQEFAQFEIWFPKSWNLGTVTFQPVWSHAATVTNFGVVFGLAGVARSNDDAGDVAFGTAQTSTDTGGTTNDIYLGPESAAITIAGTPAAEDIVQFQINRTVADGSDTMAVDARLHGIRLFYTINAATDT